MRRRMERLGERECGFQLLRLLSLAGWDVVVMPALGGGRAVIAQRGPHEVRSMAQPFAAAVLEVFERCARLSSVGDVQLELPLDGDGDAVGIAEAV